MNTNDLLKNREDFLRRPEQGIGNTQMSHIVGEHTDTRERKEQRKRRGDCTGNSSKKKETKFKGPTIWKITGKNSRLRGSSGGLHCRCLKDMPGSKATCVAMFPCDKGHNGRDDNVQEGKYRVKLYDAGIPQKW